MFTLYNDFAYTDEQVKEHFDDIGEDAPTTENEEQNIIRIWLDTDFEQMQAVFDLADKYDGYIIFGTLQRWSGYIDGYTTVEKLTDVIYKAVDGWGMCFLEIFIDNHNNLKIKVMHHDGTNILTVKGINIPTTLSDGVYCRLWDCVKGFGSFRRSDTRYFKSLGKQIKAWF